MIRTQVLEHLPGAKEGKRGGNKGNIRGGMMVKSRYIRIIEEEEVRGDDPIEYFLLTEVGSTS